MDWIENLKKKINLKDFINVETGVVTAENLNDANILKVVKEINNQNREGKEENRKKVKTKLLLWFNMVFKN